MQENFHLKKGGPPVCELLGEDTSRLTYLPYCQHPCSSYASWTFQQESSPPPVLQISSFQLSLSFPTIFPGVELVKSVTSTNQLCQKEEEQCAYCSLTSAIFPVLHPMVKVDGSGLASACSWDIPGNLLQALPVSMCLLSLCPSARRCMLFPGAVLLEAENREAHCRVQQIAGQSMILFFISFHFKNYCFLKRNTVT